MASLFHRDARGERRVSPGIYKLLLTLHILVSVAWLGVAAAKLLLGSLAVVSPKAEYADALLTAMTALNVGFPPLAVSTLITGVILSLGTRWGLFQHYWVITKLVLTFAVVGSSVQIGDRFIQQSMSGAPINLNTFLYWPEAAAGVITLSLSHVSMLAVATVLSTYKPWGKVLWARGSKKAEAKRLSPSSV